MTREVIGLFLLLIVPAFALAAYVGVRRARVKQEASLPAPVGVERADSLMHDDGLYVSTVLAESPLTRVWAHGLGVRGRVKLVSKDAGLEVHRQGEASFVIPTAQIVGLDKASATIDKAVESNGLFSIVWLLGQTQLVSNFRIPNQTTRQQISHQITNKLGA